MFLVQLQAIVPLVLSMLPVVSMEMMINGTELRIARDYLCITDSDRDSTHREFVSV